MRKLSVSISGAAPVEVAPGTVLSSIMPTTLADGGPVLCAKLNNAVVPLSLPVTVNASAQPVTLDRDDGWRAYRASLCFILDKVAREKFPRITVRVRHSFGCGLYGTVEGADDTESTTAKLEAEMRRVVDEDLPIDILTVSYADAVKYFVERGFDDKFPLLAHRNPPMVVTYDCDGFSDIAQDALVHRTGLLGTFALTPYEGGFVLRLPEEAAPHGLAPLTDGNHLFPVYREYARWSRILGATTASELNRLVMDGEVDEFVRTAEALHEKKIADIARQIADTAPIPRLVLIAGPSSSGKTTTAKRLCAHLRVLGLHPFVVSTDDFFLGDDETPRDENGKFDYECLQAIDLPLLGRTLDGLLAGREVAMPRFDFLAHAPSPETTPCRLNPDDIIIMEGIHCLNPDLTPNVPREQKFLVNVSALTQLAIDRCHRVSTTDNRLLRRIVRDYNFRGSTAVNTLRMWPSVRRGETKWIFPFQKYADVTFNTALDYEIGVLKSFALPLLNSIKPDMPEYSEASRLIGLLRNFAAVPTTAIPGDSILRESIGGSQLSY